MNHTTLKLRMTRKILITLCTLLAVGSGNYMYASVEAPVKGRTEGNGARKSGEKVDQPKSEQQKAIETQVDILNKQESAQKYAKSASKTSTVSLDNEGNGAGDTFVKQTLNVSDVSGIFGLKPEATDGISNSPGQGDNPFNTHTLTRKDGSTYTIKADRKDGTIKQMIETKKNKDNGTEESTTYSNLDGTSKPSFTSFVRETKGQNNTLSSLTSDETGVTKLTYDPKVSRINPSAKIEFKFNQDGALVDSNGNPITRETVQAKRTQATPEARTEVETAQENAPARQEAVDTAAEEITTALESGDDAAVTRAVAELAGKVLPSDVSPEQKSNFVTRISSAIGKISKMGKQTFETIKSTINSVIERWSYSRPEAEATSLGADIQQPEGPNIFASKSGNRITAQPIRRQADTVSAEQDLESGRTSMESQTSESDVAAAVPFKSYADSQQALEQRYQPTDSTSASASSTGVVDLFNSTANATGPNLAYENYGDGSYGQTALAPTQAPALRVNSPRDVADVDLFESRPLTPVQPTGGALGAKPIRAKDVSASS